MVDKVLGKDFPDDTTPSATDKVSTWDGAGVQDATLQAIIDAFIASSAEINTGTDNEKVISPDGLAGSNLGEKAFSVQVYDVNTTLAVDDGVQVVSIPSSLDGMDIVEVRGQLGTVSSSGAITVDVEKRSLSGTSWGSWASIFSTLLTIDANEVDTSTATTALIIDTSNDDLSDGDQLRINVDGAGTGAKGLWLRFICRLP